MRPIPPNPCVPTPCGPNSVCQVVTGQAQCGCQAGMIGSAPNCRPECLLSSDCPSSQACVNQICIDPCPGTCAPNAECRVVSHSPVCSCQSGYSGNGYDDCRPIPAVGKDSFCASRISLLGCEKREMRSLPTLFFLQFWLSSLAIHPRLGIHPLHAISNFLFIFMDFLLSS